MDELDIYKDLDEFRAQEPKISKELLACEQKCEDAIKAKEELEVKFKKLKKNIKTIEVNFQNLLNTARSEIRRKQREIDSLRQQYDDICFRRVAPFKPQMINYGQQEGNEVNQSINKNHVRIQSPNHSSSLQILSKANSRKAQHNVGSTSNDKREDEQCEFDIAMTFRKSNCGNNNNYSQPKDCAKYKRRSYSRSRSRSPSRCKSQKLRNYRTNKRSRSPSDKMSSSNYQGYKRKHYSSGQNSSHKLEKPENYHKHDKKERSDNHKNNSSMSKYTERRKNHDGVKSAIQKLSKNACENLSSTKKNFNQEQQVNCTASIKNNKYKEELEVGEYQETQQEDVKTFLRKKPYDSLFVPTLSIDRTATLGANTERLKLKENSNVGNNSEENKNLDTDKHKVLNNGLKHSKKIASIDKYDNSNATENVIVKKSTENYSNCNAKHKSKQVEVTEDLKYVVHGINNGNNDDIGLEPSLIKTNDKSKNNVLITDNLKTTEEFFQLTEQYFSVDSVLIKKTEHQNEDVYEEVNEDKQMDSDRVISIAAPLSQNTTNINMNGNIKAVLTADNITMNFLEKQIIGTSLSGNEIQDIEFNGNGYEENHSVLDKRKTIYNTPKKHLKMNKYSVEHCHFNLNDTVPLISTVPISEHYSRSLEGMANMDSSSILPSTKNFTAMPTNISGIFNKNPLEMSSSSSLAYDNDVATTTSTSGICDNIKKKSLDLFKKTMPERVHEYILPAVSVLCNVDHLENATKTSKLLNTDNNKHKKKKEDNDVEQKSNGVEINHGRFACLENLSNFNSNSEQQKQHLDSERNEKDTKVKEKNITKRNEILCEELFSKIKQGDENILDKDFNKEELDINLEEKKFPFHTNEDIDFDNENKIRSKNKQNKRLKSVMAQINKLKSHKYPQYWKTKNYTNNKKIIQNNHNVCTAIQSNTIGRNGNEEYLKSISNNISDEEISQNSMHIKEVKYDVQKSNDLKSYGIEPIKKTKLTKTMNVIQLPDVDSNEKQIKSSSNVAIHSSEENLLENIIPANTSSPKISKDLTSLPKETYGKYESNKNVLDEKNNLKNALINMLLSNEDDNKNDNYYTVNDYTLPEIPKDTVQDEIFKEINTKMCELFQSPEYISTHNNEINNSHHQKVQGQQEQQNQIQQQQHQQRPNNSNINDELLKSNSNDSTMNEFINLNQENDQSALNATTFSTMNNSIDINLSTTSPLNNSNINQVKYLRLGTTEYRFEKVSDNVTNLFITRKRKCIQ